MAECLLRTQSYQSDLQTNPARRDEIIDVQIYWPIVIQGTAEIFAIGN